VSTKNAQLIERIRNRKGSGEFGYGITTADKYVQHAVQTIGNPLLMKHFHCIGSGGVDGLIKRAANTLTICSPETDIESTAALIKESQEQQATSLKAMAKILGCEPPPHAMMAMVNRLTSPREDRDGDTLQTSGGNMDPKAPLLWQHVHTLPIGKMMRVVSQDKDLLRVATVLLDINDLTADACKMFEAGVLRFSHGFIAREFEERKGAGDMARFNILKFDIVEESAVSVPSNVDAEVELFCRGKLTSDVFKAHAKSLFETRNKSMAVTDKAKKIFLTKEQMLNSPVPLDQVNKNNAIRKMFDIATERLEPCTQEQDWAARYIGCSIKDMSIHQTSAGGMMIGAFLTGLEIVTQKYQITDTRNMAGQGEESPPVHKVIEIKSDERKSFLVEGIRFGKASDHRLVWRTWEGWGEQYLMIYTDNEKFAHEVIDKTWEWVAQNNPLKGQAFQLTGGWLSKTGTCWEDVFLEKDIEDRLKRTVRIINEKGADAANRGLVLSGPPGTGKTLSARVILNEANCTYIWVSAKDFWKAGAYGAFAGAFELARSLSPSIICFEDVDNWIDSYTVDLLKGEMDGLQQSSGVTTILTTNFPDDLPAALIDRPGRFGEVMEIHLPSKNVRLRMLQKWAGDATLDGIAAMADETEGYSGAHVYHLCQFAKTIRDEDECSLDDALVKAFKSIKEQRDLINQNQLSGSSYRPGRRELTAMQAKGWRGKTMELATKLDSPSGDMTMGGPVPHDGESQDVFMHRCMLDSVMIDQYPTEANRQESCQIQWSNKGAKPVQKDMGKCKECGAKADLNKDGYCADCADKEETDEEGAPKGGKPTGTKAGRVLSQRNYAVLEDAAEDIAAQLKIMELPREAKALGSAAHTKVKTVLSSAAPLDVDAQPSSTDHVLRDAVMVIADDRTARDWMRKKIEAFDKAEENEQLAESVRELESVLSPG